MGITRMGQGAVAGRTSETAASDLTGRRISPGGVRVGLAAIASIVWLAAPAGATSYSILSFADGVAIDGECRLREAIQAAASNLAVNECAAGGADDTVVLQSVGTYFFNTGEEVFSAGSLTVRGATPVAGDHIIDLQHVSRFLRVQPGARLVLEGLTLTHGDATAANPPEGGALRVQESELELRDVVITSSVASQGGGLVWVGEDAAGRLERVEFRDNLAVGQATRPSPRGGGASLLAWGDSTLILESVTFTGNRAATSEPGFGAYGGGAEIDADGPPGAPAIDLFRLTVTDNEVESPTFGDGGGILLAVGSNGRLRFEDSELSDNRLMFTANVLAGDAIGATSRHDSSLELRRLRVRGGVAAGPSTSQISLVGRDSSSILIDSVLATGADQSGIGLHGLETATLVAGQLTVSASGNVGLVADTSLGTATVRIENSILWGNGPGPGNFDLRLFGTVDADRTANHLWVGDQGDPDPLFVDPLLGDFTLQTGSAALDAGDAGFASVGPFDLRHAPRVVGGGLDLGAYESGGLFADGFEAGGPSAWTGAAP